MTIFACPGFLARRAAAKTHMAGRDPDLLFVTVPESIYCLRSYSGSCEVLTTRRANCS